LTRYRCFIRPKVHFAPEFSFKKYMILKVSATLTTCPLGAIHYIDRQIMLILPFMKIMSCFYPSKKQIENNKSLLVYLKCNYYYIRFVQHKHCI